MTAADTADRPEAPAHASSGALQSSLRHPSGTRGHNARHHEEATPQDAFVREASAARERSPRRRAPRPSLRPRPLVQPPQDRGRPAALPRRDPPPAPERARRHARQARPSLRYGGVTRPSQACRPDSSRARPIIATAPSATQSLSTDGAKVGDQADRDADSGWISFQGQVKRRDRLRPPVEPRG
jgi:hypothetical protein